ncbi:MAG: T9SS type A sorting domain-containing protein, partial [Gracilimonas sp.]
VRANDPANSLIEIPVTLEVNDAVSNEITNQPKEISLEQNYPNPFNPSTVISYQLEENSEISLQVFDMLGREVATLVNGERRAAGEHKVTFEAGNLSSGIYIYRLKTASQTLTRQMVLIK